MTALELPKPKKRGAPVILPPERKEAAIELKTSGGSNSEAAALIYNTKFPTPQQTKNVPAILRQYKKANKNRG